MKTTYHSAVPEKTETRVVVVEPAIPAKITLEVSLEEMRLLRYFATSTEVGTDVFGNVIAAAAAAAARRFLDRTEQFTLGRLPWNPAVCFLAK